MRERAAWVNREDGGVDVFMAPRRADGFTPIDNRSGVVLDGAGSGALAPLLPHQSLPAPRTPHTAPRTPLLPRHRFL